MSKGELKSKCCKVPIKVIQSDEGTAYMECTKCKKPCDIWSDVGKSPAASPTKSESSKITPTYSLEEIEKDFLAEGYSKATVASMIKGLSELPEYAVVKPKEHNAGHPSSTKSEEWKCDCKCHALGEHYPCHNPNCHSTKKQDQPAEWEKEIAKIVMEHCVYDSNCLDEDIRNLLASQKQNLIREVEGMKVFEGQDYIPDDPEVAEVKKHNKIYNRALDKVLRILKGEK